ADEPLLRLAHIVLRLRADQRLFDQDADLAPSDLVSSGLHESISHVLEHHRLQSEGRAAFAVFNQRTLPQRFDCFYHRTSVDAEHHVARQLGQAERFTLYSEPGEKLELEWRKSLSLDVEETADAAKDGAGPGDHVGQERGDVAIVHLANGFTYYLQRK